MSGQTRPSNPVLRALRVAAIAALVAALAYQAVGAAIFLPRFGSDDPREVVTAYYEAQRWGFRTIAERALSPAERARYRAPNAVRGLHDDALFASGLEVSEAADTSLYGEHDEEVQFVVTYRSAWTDEVGNPPGKRHWFVYLGRDGDGPWQVLGAGTGP
jgi:hypothetical protein